jgi:hypothetical protein
MERVRSPRPDQESSLETIGPLPSRPSLHELREAVRSPGMLRTDVDALLQGLACPLAEDEPPRARADFLLSLIESAAVSDLQGSDGRSVRTAAVQALLDLGYPYALEIPPEALSKVDLHSEAGPQELPTAGLIATGVGLLVQLGYAAPGLLKILEGSGTGSLIGALIFLGMVLGPAASAVLGGLLRARGIQRLGILSMAVTGSLWLTGFFVSLFIASRPLAKPDTWLALVAGLGFLLGAVLTRRPEWLAEGDAPSKDSPPPEPRP